MRKLTRREKVLLVVLVIVSLISFSINKYAQKKAEEVERLWAQFQAEFAEVVQSKIKSVNNARELGNTVSSSFHDDIYKDGVLVKNHEDGWVKVIDSEKNIVEVATIDSKTKIIFHTDSEHLKKFNIGWIAPVTLECIKMKNGNCDFTKPNTLYVGNQKVDLIEAIKN